MVPPPIVPSLWCPQKLLEFEGMSAGVPLRNSQHVFLMLARFQVVDLAQSQSWSWSADMAEGVGEEQEFDASNPSFGRHSRQSLVLLTSR